ncbi:MAG: YoaK family protein [Bdellovibrionia bacterium]
MFTYNSGIAQYSRLNAFIWGLMAFQAGAINVGGFLACHKFVSHVTGFATHFAASLAHGELYTAFGLISVPLFFLFGSFISGMAVDTRIQKAQKPLYPLIFGLMSILLLAVTVAGVRGDFGAFGSPINLVFDYSLLAALSLSSGLQNATVTSAFNSVVRTTHLTGLTTDLGIGFARLLRRAHSKNSRENEILATGMRLFIIVSFISGSSLSGFIFFHAEYWGFLIPSSIAIILWVWSLKNFSKNGKAS